LAIVAGLIALFTVAVGVLCPSRTRTDKLEITAIDDGYMLFFRTDGRVLFPPVSAEGIFPAWGEGAVLHADGPGEQTTLDGCIYKKYRMGKDLRATVFSGCTVYLSESERRLIVQGSVVPGRRFIDRSGTYNNIKIVRPKIISLTPDIKTADLDGQYIRARGRFTEWHFETEGRTFYAPKPFEVNDHAQYDVIARVRCYKEPQLFIVSCRRATSR
jgi:hypothetical protein